MQLTSVVLDGDSGMADHDIGIVYHHQDRATADLPETSKTRKRPGRKPEECSAKIIAAHGPTKSRPGLVQ